MKLVQRVRVSALFEFIIGEIARNVVFFDQFFKASPIELFVSRSFVIIDEWSLAIMIEKSLEIFFVDFWFDFLEYNNFSKNPILFKWGYLNGHEYQERGKKSNM